MIRLGKVLSKETCLLFGVWGRLHLLLSDYARLLFENNLTTYLLLFCKQIVFSFILLPNSQRENYDTSLR